MTDETAGRLAEARRDYCAAMYVVAQITGDRELVNEAVRRLAAYGGPGCVTEMLTRALHLIVEKTDLVDLEPVVVAMRDYMGRLLTQVGAERLNPGDAGQLDPAKLDVALRRLLGGDEGDGAL
ncbi:hypothetical protein [Mycobacterium sp. pR1184]|uniref:hypothetical protein n=1 Tax=Mycobacterium sp. pR1184 TaxID=3238981 RepID=UPI00351B1567